MPYLFVSNATMNRLLDSRDTPVFRTKNYGPVGSEAKQASCQEPPNATRSRDQIPIAPISRDKQRDGCQACQTVVVAMAVQTSTLVPDPREYLDRRARRRFRLNRPCRLV